MNMNSSCAKCPFKPSDKLCKDKQGKALPFCPTRDKQDILQKSLAEYDDPEINEFAKQSAIQEHENYIKSENSNHLKPTKTRMEEIVDFAKKMNYKKLGLAFCIGLVKEAKIVEKILVNNGFEVSSVICKVGSIPKEHVGLKDNQKVHPGKFESMCNPVMQAKILNDEKTKFNIVLGLCVGHDSMFFKFSDAMCTVLAVKDRLLGHNPLAAIYTSDSYYKFLDN